MSCPTTTRDNPPEFDAQCKCRNGRIGRWVTFRWQVDLSGNASCRTMLSIHDGNQRLNSFPQQSTVNGTLQERIFLEPGDYRWMVLTTAPEECVSANPKPTDGDPLAIDSCCSEVETLVGPFSVFAVNNDQPGFDLTGQLKEGGCVTTDAVIVSLPLSDCPATIEWLPPASADPNVADRTLQVPLPADGTPVAVTARVRMAGCAAKDMSLIVGQCTNGGEKEKCKKKWWCLGPDGCPFYEAMAIYPIIGMFFFSALALFVGLLADLASLFFVTGYGAVATGALVIIAFFLAGIALGCAICVLIFTFFWWSCCSPSPCRVYEDIEWALGWSIFLCTFVPIMGWFFLPMQFLAFLILRPLMISNNCKFLQPFSLPHLRPR